MALAGHVWHRPRVRSVPVTSDLPHDRHSAGLRSLRLLRAGRDEPVASSGPDPSNGPRNLDGRLDLPPGVRARAHDNAIPITSHAYAGNRPDVTQFSDVLDEGTARYCNLFPNPDHNEADGTDSGTPAQMPTVVFDAGQNSAANFAHLDRTGLHFVGSLPPSPFPDLLAIPPDQRTTVDPDRFEGLSAYDTRAGAFGTDRRIILTHSQTLHDAQARSFDQTLNKTTRKLSELAATLARGKTRRDKNAVQATIDTITSKRWVNRVLSTELTGNKPTDLRLSCNINPDARGELETEFFGKRLLVTDRGGWSIADVVAGYRSQNDGEDERSSGRGVKSTVGRVAFCLLATGTCRK